MPRGMDEAISLGACKVSDQKLTNFKIMNIKKLMMVAAMAAFVGFNTNAKAVSFDYASDVGGMIDFLGNGQFTFTPPLLNFVVTSGSAAGRFGEIDGTFTIGTIVGNTAPVTGTGTFSIIDGTHLFTSTLNWVDIGVLGAVGGLNFTANINLTDISYSGSNPDLLALKNNGSGVNTLSFQFPTAYSLEYLSTHRVENSFSGTVASAGVPDGGATVALLGLSLVGIGFANRKFGALSLLKA